MRVLKLRTLRATAACTMLVGVAAAAPTVAVASAPGTSGSRASGPPSATIGAAPSSAPAPTGGVQPFNTGYGQCVVLPGAPCTVTYISDTGRSTATFLFSDGTEASSSYYCNKKTCTLEATGYPNSLSRDAVRVTVNGPHISIISVT